MVASERVVLAAECVVPAAVVVASEFVVEVCLAVLDAEWSVDTRWLFVDTGAVVVD